MANSTEISSNPVAIVTGGASGIGLSVAEHMVSKGWNVAIFDLNQDRNNIAERDLTFFKVDVADYEQQADAFANMWDKWRRLDFVFANAGIGDRIDFSASAEARPNGTPPRPDTAVLDVCLNGVTFTSYLALHFFRQNANKGGKLVSTSSMAGIYPSKRMPLYAAAKHGVVGFTRSLAGGLRDLGEPITVNCICPGLLDTGLTGILIAVAPEHRVTPHSTIIKAIDSFIEDDTKTGIAAECSEDKIYYHGQQAWSDESAEWVMTVKWEEMIQKGRHDK